MIPRHVWTYPGFVDGVIDGDTVVAHVYVHPFEGGELHGVHIRVDGINALELSQKYGGEARDYARKLLSSDVGSFVPGLPITLVARHAEKYGRWLCGIVLPDSRDFGSLMLTARASDGTTPLAVPYLP